MKEVGIVIILVGLSMGYFAFDMDVSVSVNDYSTGLGNYQAGKVANLSKMNQQQNFVIAASALCIIGTILLAASQIEKRLTPSVLPSPIQTAVNNKLVPDNSDDTKLTAKQKDLKAKYERSEISLEEYTNEWNKLS